MRRKLAMGINVFIFKFSTHLRFKQTPYNCFQKFRIASINTTLKIVLNRITMSNWNKSKVSSSQPGLEGGEGERWGGWGWGRLLEVCFSLEVSAVEARSKKLGCG